jgi:hypothetical protein
VLPNFGQANAVQSFSPNVKGVAPFLLLSLQSLLMPSVKSVESIFPLVFGL